MKIRNLIIGVLALLLPSLAQPSTSAQAQGTLPIALTQQFAFTNCATFTNACGTPLSGGLLYFYQAGTVATVQNSFQDTALTITNPWPLVLDSNGRVPNFYLANGSVHVRLTDANGVVQFDVPSMLVVGASSGGGGGGSVDPTTIASTGDIKFRLTSEFVTGWVKANAQTIGNATSGATQRANADTQALFTYLWTNCPDAHCPVLGGRGASGLADFNAAKQITLPDCRGRICGVGLDDMGNAAAGRIFAANVTSGGGDTVTTPNATGGAAQITLTQAQLPAVAPTFTGTNAAISVGNGGTIAGAPASQNDCCTGGPNPIQVSSTTTTLTGNFTPSGTISTLGSGAAINVLSNFMLGTWYIKL
jgi:hypothetical protein